MNNLQGSLSCRKDNRSPNKLEMTWSIRIGSNRWTKFRKRLNKKKYHNYLKRIQWSRSRESKNTERYAYVIFYNLYRGFWDTTRWKRGSRTHIEIPSKKLTAHHRDTLVNFLNHLIKTALLEGWLIRVRIMLTIEWTQATKQAISLSNKWLKERNKNFSKESDKVLKTNISEIKYQSS